VGRAGSATAGSVSVVGMGAVPVGSASVGGGSTGAAPAGSASVGSASVVVSKAPAGAASAAVLVKAGAAVVGGNGRAGAHPVPVKSEGAAPVVGARAGAAKAAAGGLDVADGAAETPGGLRGAGVELRNKMRARRRLRVATLLSLAVVVLVVLPAVFGLVSANRDPVFSSLDALGVPSWASKQINDQVSGSRWCFLDCPFRERIAQSDQPFQPTTQAYTNALRKSGWQLWNVGECPDAPIPRDQVTYSCWRRDEFTLDLRVGPPECAVDQVAEQQDPGALPLSAEPRTPTGKCAGSTVSIKVQNAIADTRGAPASDEKPKLGVTPAPVLSNDPLLEPTPKAS
jgi:integrin beta 3